MTSKTSKAFDLEEKIVSTWGLVDKLDTIKILINQGRNEDAANALQGLKVILSMDFDEMFALFEEVLKEIPLTYQKGDTDATTD